MWFWAHSGAMWVDLAMSNHFMYRLRRHLMKLHCRYDQISPVWPKSCIRISGLQKGHAMMFRARPGVTWLDIVMAKYYRHSLRRHLIKLHPRNDQITIVRSAMQVSFLHCDDDIHKKIDRWACQAKQPRVDAFYGQKWWLSHSCHLQCDGSIVCPTGAVVLSRLFVHRGETLFVNWFVPQRKILAAKLSCGMRPTTPRPNLELSATGHYFIDFDVTQSPDWTPHRSDPVVRPNAFQKPS